MKSYIVALKNRFPGAIVKGDDHSVNAYSQDGEHLCSVVKNGHGQWVDNKDGSGAKYEFCLAPIPKDCRVWKLSPEGKIERDDRHEDRSPIAESAAKKNGGKVPSIAQLHRAKNGDKARLSDDSHKMNYSDFDSKE